MSYYAEGYYCQYVEGPCPESEVYPTGDSLFFAYPSKPETSTDAIQGAIQLINDNDRLNVAIYDWRDLPIEGRIIFCEICKAVRQSSCVVLNITKANFNVLFEYGFALGLNKALWPIVEEGIEKAKRSYAEIETLTTLGYSRFTNSQNLYKKMSKKKPWAKTPSFTLPTRLGESPTTETMGLLYLKSPHNNEPSLRVSEALSLLPLELITDDPTETPFQSFYWYLKRIGKAFAVLINLGSPEVVSIEQHWAKCALVAGISLALGRRVLMIGENITLKPIDYRALIRNYKNAAEAERITLEFMSPLADSIKALRGETAGHFVGRPTISTNILGDIDLGDYIAENEVEGLSDYFVETPIFVDSFEPQFKVYVGRKGTGKTANFLMLLDRLNKDKRNIVCQIKPKEYELYELLEFVNIELNVAKKGYLLESLWKFMLYSEVLKTLFERISRKPVEAISASAEKEVLRYVQEREFIYNKSFTSRLVEVVRNLCSSQSEQFDIAISEILHTGEIGKIHRMICDCIGIGKITNFTIMIDGLDANWRLGEDYKIMADILLSLIGAARDMWRACKADIDKMKGSTRVSILIFLRGDVFKVVLDRAREPDKLIFTQLYWPNVDSLVQIVEKRIMSSLGQNEGKTISWQDFLEPGFTLKIMAGIIENNILFRPRDIICYYQNVIYHARSRGTSYLTKRDFSSAMRDYSEYAFRSLAAESQPYIPSMADLLFEFAERPQVLSFDEANTVMSEAGIESPDFTRTLDFLLESNFLGYGIDDYNYKFPTSPPEVELALRRALRHSANRDKPRMFKIHRAFHEALAIV